MRLTLSLAKISAIWRATILLRIHRGMLCVISHCTILSSIVMEAITTDMDDDLDTDSLKQKTRTRFSVGPANWLGTWGSNGP